MTAPEHPEELLAGAALHALDPEDEERLTSHLRSCASCRALLAEFEQAVAPLAELSPGARPPASLRERIIAAAGSTDPVVTPAAGTQTDGTPAPVLALPTRLAPRRGWRTVAAAAAAAAVVVGGIWGGLAATSGGRVQPLADVTLSSTATHSPAARVVVTAAGVVYLEAVRLRPDDPARQIYVLWQAARRRRPLAIGAFDVRRGQAVPVRIGTLVAPYADTTAFMVSLQAGRAIPATPSSPVALGSARG